MRPMRGRARTANRRQAQLIAGVLGVATTRYGGGSNNGATVGCLPSHARRLPHGVDQRLAGYALIQRAAAQRQTARAEAEAETAKADTNFPGRSVSHLRSERGARQQRDGAQMLIRARPGSIASWRSSRLSRRR